ncbi:MAG: regulatory protein RecX, partial [Firmicutes bacterium]|nr:regulatory protein RecX [Bacillota bacterium]
LLEYRDHSRKELRLKLLRNFSPQAADSAIEKIVEMGLIDDARYAQKLAEELLRRKRLSPSAIRSELIMRGISREDAQNVCDLLDVDERQAITELLETKFASKLSDEKSRSKVFSALLRMGYSYSDIRAAMRLTDD